MPSVVKAPWYDADHAERKVQRDGTIHWRGTMIYIGDALAREPVGIIGIDDGLRVVRFCGRDLGAIERDIWAFVDSEGDTDRLTD